MSKAPAKPAPEGAAPQEGKKKGKKKVVLIGAPLLVVGLLAGLWFSFHAGIVLFRAHGLP